MPKVLIADKLSPAAVAIFQERGVEADVKTGLSKEELIKIVDQYDAIAIRSATKLTADVHGTQTHRADCRWAPALDARRLRRKRSGSL